MTSTPQISICLPLYNGAKHLKPAIESILAQDFSEFELLIADDGSNDGGAEIAAEYAARDKRIQFWKNEARQGLFGNYNACIRKASAKYIKPFAQDDLLVPDCLSTMLAVLEKEVNVALVSSSRQIIDDAGSVTELKQPIDRDLRVSGKEVISFHLIGLNNWVGEPSTVMFRAKFAGSGFDSSYYHYGDIEYWFRILMNGDFCYLKRPLASFRRHASSQTDKNHRELYFALDILRLSLTYRELLADIEPDALMKRRLAEKIALEHGHVLSAALPEDLLEMYQRSFLDEAPRERAKELVWAARFSADDQLDRLKSEARGFRLLASMSLSTISELIKELDHEKRCRHDEHELFKVEVDKMRNSIYWKLGTPLRTVRRALRGDSD